MHSKLTAVAICTAVTVIGGGGYAVADTVITGKKIKNGSLTNADVKKGTIKLDRLSKGTQALVRRAGKTGANGANGAPGAPGASGADGTTGTAGAGVAGSGNWGTINRNTIGAGFAQLRSGPAGAPLGKGSLNIDVGDANSKVSFGNDTDFAGLKVADITDLSFSVFTTRENRGEVPAADPRPDTNLPTVNMEVDPNVVAGADYSSLVYVPQAAPAGWTKVDLADNAYKGFYFTNGATAAATGCSQGAPGYCTLQELKTKAPNMEVSFSLGFNKGRDYEFHGAVDALQVNDSLYDFEETGVTETLAP